MEPSRGSLLRCLYLEEEGVECKSWLWVVLGLLGVFGLAA